MASGSNIHFFFKDVTVALPGRTRLKVFINRIFKDEGKKLEALNYIFCNDRELLKINKIYLKHDFFTDIVTFDLSESKQDIVGEIYISTERVRENAAVFGATLKKELLRVIFHGALHLCNYTDKSERQKREMRKKEDFYISAYLNSP